MSKIALSAPIAGVGTATIRGPETATDIEFQLPSRAGQVLVTGPSFSAYPASAQTITTSTWSKVNLGVEDWDTANCYDTATSRFTPNVAGIYQVTMAFGCTTSVSLIGVLLKKNGNDEMYGNVMSLNSTLSNSSASTCLVSLNGSTDYIEMFVFAVGTTPSIDLKRTVTRFQANLVRPI